MMPTMNLAAVREGGELWSGNMEKLSKMDEVARKVILGLSEADTVSSLAQGAAVQSLEQAATDLYKEVLNGASNDVLAMQTTDIAKSLAKLLPQKKPEEKKIVLKAKNAEPVVRKGEEANKEAMKALEGAFS